MNEAIYKFITHPLVWLAILGVIGTAVVYIAKYFYWKGHVDSDLNSFKEFMQEVRMDIKKILERLPPRTVTPGSPLKLTSFGERIAQRFGAQKWAKEQIASVAESERLVELEPYQIDVLCKRYVEDELNVEDRDNIQACAYSNGIEFDDVAQVLKVVLRQEIINSLESHYRCRADDDDKLWHFHRHCPNWPTTGFEAILRTPTVGTYCSTCEALKKHDETSSGTSDNDIPF